MTLKKRMFNKFKYEAEFVKETKKDNQKADKK